MNILQRISQQFWFIPALLCTLAMLLAEGLIQLDELISTLPRPPWLDSLLYRVGESGSRDILSTIAGSSLAVAGTTFSITMAVLALTSSTYGPRLIRNFMADRGNQFVLGVYVATFLYALLVLRSVRALGDSGDPDAKVFVPHLAVNMAVMLAVLNVAVLIYFIHHISGSIQISQIAQRVRADLRDTIERLYPEDVGHDESEIDGDATLPSRLEEDGVPVHASRPGYISAVRNDDLLEAATDADVVVKLRARPGKYVLDDSVLAWVHPPQRATEELADAIRSAIRIANARSPYQDISFAVQQLTELAVRALSPGTNDPFTAINALDDLSSGLALLAGRRMPSTYRFDTDGSLRIYAPYVDAVELTSGVLDNVRWYAASSPAVMHAALTLVTRVGRRADEQALRARLLTQIRLLEDAFARAEHQQHDVEEFTARAQQVARGLARVG